MYRINIQGSTDVEKISMFILATFPILGYYVFSMQFSYSDIAGIVVFVLALANGKYRGFKIPHYYAMYWAYSALQIYLIAGIGGWSDYIPGGVNFLMFSLFLFGFSVLFNLDLLYKYMRRLFVLASVLLIVQIIAFYTTGHKISFFLPLGQMLTYQGFSYAELVEIHNEISTELIERFSSIFTEPSAFAQYAVFLLAIELFRGKNKNELLTKFSVFISVILVLIQAGAGYVGMLFVIIVKLIYVIFVTRRKKYYLYLAVLIPVFIYAINTFLLSSSGAYVAERTNEMAAFDDRDQTGSTFVRIYYGWYSFFDMDKVSQLLGTSRSYVSSLREGGFFNGITYVLCSQGAIGLILLIMFYVDCCRKNAFYVIALVLTFLIISLIGATYIGTFMMIVTTVALGSKLQITKYGFYK